MALKTCDGDSPIALRIVKAAAETRARISAYSISACPSSSDRKAAMARTNSWVIKWALLFGTLHRVIWRDGPGRNGRTGGVFQSVRLWRSQRHYAVTGGLNRPLVGCRGSAAALQSVCASSRDVVRRSLADVRKAVGTRVVHLDSGNRTCV